MDEQKKPMVYTITETAAVRMIESAGDQIDIAADLLDDNVAKDPLDMKLISCLCDLFSSNYHVRKTLRLNLSSGTIEDEKSKEKIILLEEKDLIILENAILSTAFTKKELLKLNYSIVLH